MTQQRPHPGRVMLDPGEALDHGRDPLQRPELPGEPIGRRSLEQGLFHGGELGIRQPG
jgi:hypothetical protein